MLKAAFCSAQTAEGRRLLLSALCLFAVALCVRVGSYLQTDVIFNDGPILLSIASEISAGRWRDALAHDQHPGYPLVIAALSGLFDSPFDAATAISLLSGSLAVIALFTLLLQAWNTRCAFVGAWMLAIHPYAARHAADVQSDALYLALFLTAASLLYKALGDRAPHLALAAGACSGLAYDVRPEGIGVCVAGLALATLQQVREPWPGRRIFPWLLSLAAGATLAAGPYAISSWLLRGEASLTQKKVLSELLGLPRLSSYLVAKLSSPGDPIWTSSAAWLALAATATALFLVVARRFRRSPIGLQSEHVLASIGVVVAALVLIHPAPCAEFLATTISTLRPDTALFFVLGVHPLLRQKPGQRASFALTFIAIYATLLFALLVGYGYLSRRHVLPPLMLLLGYAGAGAVTAAEMLAATIASQGRFGAAARSWGLAGVLVLVLCIALPKAWHPHRADQIPLRIAAEWLRDHAAGSDRLASSRIRFAWYAGLEWRTSYVDGRVRPLRDLHAEHVTYVLVDDDELDASGRPPVEWRDDPGFLLVRMHETSTGMGGAVVFALVERGEPMPRPAGSRS